MILNKLLINIGWLMNSILLIIIGLLYLGIAFGYLVDGKTGLAIAFFAYAISNYGLYLAGK